MPPRSTVRHMEHTCHGEWRTPLTRSDPSNSCIQLSHCPTGTNSAPTAHERRGRDGESAAGTSSRRVCSGAMQQPAPCDGMRCGARGRCGGPLRARRHRSDRLLVDQQALPTCSDMRCGRRGPSGHLVPALTSARKQGSAQALRSGTANRGPSATTERYPCGRTVRAVQSPHKAPPGQL